ncbi:MAG: NAD(P)H-hydrate dehydratase [Lachnospiraceae bacterium]|nr:NAD(P)H-hydrate dehydratase [Lachnospiraceae bacterium]
MERLLNAGQMKACDEYTIRQIGIPSAVLMERAALAVVEEMHKARLDLSRVLVVCGSGNNGGDGFAVARLLSQSCDFSRDFCDSARDSCGSAGNFCDFSRDSSGLAQKNPGIAECHSPGASQVTIAFVGREASMSDETRLQKKICENLGLKSSSNFMEGEYTVIVDAVFGIGLSRSVEGRYADVIRWMNDRRAKRVAVDIPSGISADDGRVMGTAVKADLTVTFAARKIGQILYPGAAYCGQLICRDIGICMDAPVLSLALLHVPSGAVSQAFSHASSQISLQKTGVGNTEPPFIFTYTKHDLDKIPARSAYSNKGTYGKVLLIAGSEGMSGAAVLSAKSAFRTGCGMVRIFTPECNRTVIQTCLPEAIVTAWDPQASLEDTELLLKNALDWSDAACIGPGLGTSSRAASLLQFTLQYYEKSLVIDADALNLLAKKRGERAYQEAGEDLSGIRGKRILTPHIGEMVRLTGKDKTLITGDLIAASRSLADAWGVTCVLKDARTAVSDGKQVYLNTSGNDGMAVAGSGDVLSGLISGLLAQGMACFEAAVLGVYLHGLAGDLAQKELGSYGMIAGDIAERIGRVMRMKDRLLRMQLPSGRSLRSLGGTHERT